MHQNSIQAFREITSDGSRKKRAEIIMDVFNHGGKYTDYQVLQILKPGSDNINFVQPRITELIQNRKLVECGVTRDLRTMKNVRLVCVPRSQVDMF